MTNLHDVYGEFLADTGADVPATMGPRPETPVNPHAVKRLDERLGSESRTTNRLLWVVASMYVVIFIAAMVLVWRFRDSPTVFGLLFGGAVVGVLGVARQAQQLWSRQANIELVRRIIGNVSASDSSKLIQAIYYSDERQRQRKRSSSSQRHLQKESSASNRD
jgi:hypothetical protein